MIFTSLSPCSICPIFSLPEQTEPWPYCCHSCCKCHRALLPRLRLWVQLFTTNDFTSTSTLINLFSSKGGIMRPVFLDIQQFCPTFLLWACNQICVTCLFVFIQKNSLRVGPYVVCCNYLGHLSLESRMEYVQKQAHQSESHICNPLIVCMSGFVSELRSYLYWEMTHVNAHSRTTSGSALILIQVQNKILLLLRQQI